MELLTYRTQKELESYHKELKQQMEKIEGMKERNEDEFDIKKQVCRSQEAR